MKPRAWRSLAGVLALMALLAHTAGYLRIGLMDRFDAIGYDTLLRWTAPGEMDERIVIVNIDERALEEIGRWPWHRDRLADLVDRIFERHGALLLGLDVILAEPDDSSGLTVLSGLADGPMRDNPHFQATFATLRPQLDFDQRLAASLARHPVVLACHLTGQQVGGPSPATRLRPALPAASLSAVANRMPDWGGYKTSLPAFQQVAVASGHINGIPDFDGVVRRVPLLAKVTDEYQQALGLAMARVITGNAALQPAFADTGGATQQELESLVLATPRGPLAIPVDGEARALIPYRGPVGSFPYVSAADILADRLPANSLRNRIVLLGTTAPGLVDLRVTPYGAAYPGVEIHANLISGILDGRVKAMPGYLTGLQLVLLTAIGLVMIGLLPGRSPRGIAQLTALLGVAVVLLQVWMWLELNMFLPAAAPLTLIALLFGLHMVFGYFIEVHNRHSMARLFGQYVPPELVREMSRDPDRYDMEGKSVRLSVLFADIRGFTALSEGMPAQELARMMNEFFSAMAAVVREQRGTLDKYLGDAVMAFWGAPVADLRHADHAVAAALAMQVRLADINDSFPRRGWPRLEIGIGINTGDMTVGDMGSADRRAYTVLGDAVNLAARLVDLTGYYGAGIVIGETTQAALKGMVCRELDRVTVQGRASAVTLYEPLGPTSDMDAELESELERWRHALTSYRARQWDTAEATLKALMAQQPQRLYQLYLDRIARLRVSGVPEDWDGVWRFGRKQE